MCKEYLALNNQQGLMGHKIKPNPDTFREYGPI